MVSMLGILHKIKINKINKSFYICKVNYDLVEQALPPLRNHLDQSELKNLSKLSFLNEPEGMKN